MYNSIAPSSRVVQDLLVASKFDKKYYNNGRRILKKTLSVRKLGQFIPNIRRTFFLRCQCKNDWDREERIPARKRRKITSCRLQGKRAWALHQLISRDTRRISCASYPKTIKRSDKSPGDSSFRDCFPARG